MRLNPQQMHQEFKRAGIELGLIRHLGLTTEEATLIVELAMEGEGWEGGDYERAFKSLIGRNILHPVAETLGMHERWGDGSIKHMVRPVLWYVYTGKTSLLEWWKEQQPNPFLSRGLKRWQALQKAPLEDHADETMMQFLQFNDNRWQMKIEEMFGSLSDQIQVWLLLSNFAATGLPVPLHGLSRLAFPAEEMCAPRAHAWRNPNHPIYKTGHVLIAEMKLNQVQSAKPSAALLDEFELSPQPAQP